ncbi:GIN domain-containing protein [Mucilaginibacter ginkgonis]|uniref:DUF2807 domain-containing protein n=1 Tax=Mucilaginibacter ginkgonis TaxID=2682091 RepID=A0A6I4I5A7_9SPHI|nr:DUF2807 domain-containing protein [Mucilaginibacter ginkgonis]QQL48347.1 DUF2807 domain-containing protein [Mucilaginibacter ginkgonis]
MKTRILTVAALLTLAVTTTSATFASTVKEKAASTVLTDVKHINKIEVRGNVELYVSEGADDNVKVYNKYYSENALVQNQNGVLRISAYNTDKLVVWVTASDLRNISAYDNTTVKSFGKLSGIELGVDLYNHAAADLDLTAYNATINVNDAATANLSGDATQCNLKYSQYARVNAVKFNGNLVRTVNFDRFAKTEQLTGLE